MQARVETLKVSRAQTAIFVALLAIVTLAPLMRNQFLTGPVVNASLIIAVVMLGSRSGMMLGLLPSVLALGTGILNPVMAPQIPFIMAANVIFVLAFAGLNRYGFWKGLVTASLLKTAFLFGTSFLTASLITSPTLAGSISQMMSWPQLATALAGGVIAFGMLKAATYQRH
jgi:hypothetical protein